MKSFLGYVADMIEADFVEHGCPAEVLFGEEKIQYHAAPNRVVVCPRRSGDRFKMPQQMWAKGGQPQSVATWQPAGANPQPIRTRVIGCTINIWARGVEQSDPEKQRDVDQAALDAMLNQVMAALYRVAAGNEGFPGGRQLVGLKDVRFGLVYELDVDVEVPIVEIDWPPGVIDERSFTWPTASPTGIVAVQMIQPTGTVIAEVDFPAGS